MGGQVSKVEDCKREEDTRVIASIDFGTKYTGYAFMLRDSEGNPDIYRPNQAVTKCEQTCILLQNTDDAGFVAFGNKALEMFDKIQASEKHKYHFFRLFKTDLFLEENELLVRDHMDRKFNASMLFSKAYGYFQSEVKSCLSRSVEGGNDIKNEDILWVITIPASGSDLFKSFIRNVAEKRYDQIKIILEPEAASMYIKNKPLHYIHGQQMHIQPLKPHKCYMLVDIGAGTSDICVHKVREDGNLIEILSAGIPEGGEKINKAFFNCLEELLSANVLNEFKNDTMRFHKIEKDFEEIKHKLTPNDDIPEVLLMDEKLLKLFAKTTEQKFETFLKQSKFTTKLEIRDNNLLYMSKEFMRDLFDPTIHTLIAHIQEQICRATKAEYMISCILLSGGLSESQYVFSRIESHFSRGSNTNDVIPVIQAPNARNAVVDGALLMGLQPNGIVGRVSPYTYGFYSIVPFIEGEHPEELKDFHEGAAQCKAVFYKLIDRNRIVRSGDCFERRSSTVYIQSKNTKRITSLWRSFQQDPKYCTPEYECEIVARIKIQPPAEGWPPKLDHIQRLVVIDNEFVVEFENATTGQKYKTRVVYAF